MLLVDVTVYGEEWKIGCHWMINGHVSSSDLLSFRIFFGFVLSFPFFPILIVRINVLNTLQQWLAYFFFLSF